MGASPHDPADYAFHHWRQFESNTEHAERVEAAEATAGRYFASSTIMQLREFNGTMGGLRMLRGPIWDRKREAAQRKWDESTAGARALFYITADEIMRDGEVSEATSLAWDVLTEKSDQDYQDAPPPVAFRTYRQVMRVVRSEAV